MYRKYQPHKGRSRLVWAVIVLAGLAIGLVPLLRSPSWPGGGWKPTSGTTLAAPNSGQQTTVDFRENSALPGEGKAGVPELPEAFRNGVSQESVTIVTTVTPSPGTRRKPGEIVARLAFLKPPLEGVKVPNYAGQLPGAPRPYRNGIHQAIDYYSGYAGIIINKSTPVLAAADGLIIRIDHDYREMTRAELDQILSVVKTGGSPVGKDLDRLHGRQVWLLHENGVVTRYSHLNATEPGLKVGDRVKAGGVIGRVGNSGTDSGVLGNDEDVHLDFQIFINLRSFWEGLTPVEARGVLVKVFDQITNLTQQPEQ